MEDAGLLWMMKPGKRPITGVYGGQQEKFKNRYPEAWNSAEKFAIVRNPYDKFISGWRYLDATKNRSLKDVLENPPTKSESLHDYNHLTRSQSSMLCDENGNLITKFIVKYENLGEELNDLLTKLELPQVEIPWTNKTKKREPGYRKYFDSETRALFEERFSKDLELFDYQF